ncbi:thiol:disulfide oxidoreductase [Sphingobium sp. TA15]|uniref:Glutathione S-transferase n=1 Tax=Sphingobium indicum (strain DSM 16413 / CCM 7287 / MTCC 6362 / UT26 / NBRC 101211 / UT26S) TaxID=452662 RepID=D4Z2I8_SPHIU|nr:glutathione binding-like protein [Sphingobium indicum]BAI96820.1 glutathione S-transferase [Sphingobium indicum UT26S]BDD66257.1 thiol:disulfide oxidoreductase [Sphingobium sp. TA15]
MIDVYAFATPNSVKVPIALEEMGLDYTLHSVDIRTGGQKDPVFRALNPNAKVPVLIDHDASGGPLVLSESAAILIYLAEKTGKLLPAFGAPRARVFEQLFFHGTAMGPAFGNAGYFQKFAPERIPHAIERFLGEANRVTGVLDALLAKQKFVAGDEFSIADIVNFGWLWQREFVGVNFDATPNLARWFAELDARPAFRRAISKTTALAAS